MLVTVSLLPDQVHFDVADRHEEYLINGTPAVFDIEDQYGKVAIEVREQKLSLTWAPSEEPPPNNPITASYFRATDALYYPELLIAFPGFVQISRRTT